MRQIFLLLGLLPIIAQGQIRFNKPYDYSHLNDGGFCILEYNGFYYNTVISKSNPNVIDYDFMLSKLDLLGNIMDTFRIQDSGILYNPASFQTSTIIDRNLIYSLGTKLWEDTTIPGYYRRQIMLGNFDPTTCDTNWVKYYGDTSVYYWNHMLYKSKFGDFYFVAGSKSHNQQFSTGGALQNCHLMKIDTLGNVIWDRVYPATKYELIGGISERWDQKIVLGCARFEHGPFWDSAIVCTRLLDSMGYELSIKDHMVPTPLLAGGAFFMERLIPNRPEQYIISGLVDTAYNQMGSRLRYAFVSGLDSNLDIIWRRNIPVTAFPDAQQVRDLAVFDDGKIMILGTQLVDPLGYYGWVALLDIDANLLWSHTYFNRDSADHYLSTVTKTLDGGYLITGVVNSTNANNTQDAWLFKIDSLGCLDTTQCWPLGTQILEPKKDDLIIYPNPANTKITLQSELLNNQENNIQILNIIGQGILHEKRRAQNGRLELNISDLPEGVYLIMVNEWVRKLIVE